MATGSFGGAEDDDVLGKAISDYEARDTCEINVKKDDQVEILGQTDDGTHFVVLNKRTNQQGECPISIIDIYDEELDRLRKDMIDGGKLKLRKNNVQKEGMRSSPGMNRAERGHGIVMEDKPEFVQSVPLAKQLIAANTDDFVMVNKPVEKFTRSCVVQPVTPTEFASIDRHNIVSVAGTDKDGRPVIVFSACRLPPSYEINHHKLLDYLIYTVDQYVESDYTILYLHYGLTTNNKPSFSWLRQMYKALDRKYKKNLKKLYIVHPTRFIKMMYILSKPFISYKFGKKLTYVNRLDELKEILYLEQVDIPQEVKNYDAKLKYKIPQQEPSSKFYTGFDDAGASPTQQFGIPLSILQERNGGDPIPMVIHSCTEYLEKTGLNVEGIFRRTTGQSMVKRAKAQLNEGKQVDFEDPHLAAVLLKQFLRELPEPVLMYSTYTKLRGFKGRTDEDKISCCKQVVQELVEPNKTVFLFLMDFLVKVCEQRDVNKMSANNLAIVIGPNLLWAADQAATLMSLGDINSFTQIMIMHHAKILGTQKFSTKDLTSSE